MRVGVAVWFMRPQQDGTSDRRCVPPVLLDPFLVRVGDEKALAAVEVEVVGRQRKERVAAGGEVWIGTPREQGHESLVVHLSERRVDVLDIERPRQRVEAVNAL